MVLLKEAREHPDVVLVEECRQGDSSAFGELVRRYKDRIYNVAYRFLGNHEDAQDVSQEAFVRAYRGIQSFKGRANVYTWLYSIAGNLAKNKLRDAGRMGRDHGVSLEALEARGAPRKASASENPEQSARASEMDAILQDCLRDLPEHYRMVFVLRTFDELSYEEIADTLGCPEGTVKSRLNQARKLLRERLKELDVF